MEKDEVYLPQTNTEIGLPEKIDPGKDYGDVLGDTPIYTLYMLIQRQVLAFPAYLRQYNIFVFS
jgi:omega-6 fatty acid desaturase (delta-12 desaturase)